jgi:hypothetical protein
MCSARKGGSLLSIRGSRAEPIAGAVPCQTRVDGPHRLPDETDFTYPSASTERSEAKE